MDSLKCKNLHIFRTLCVSVQYNHVLINEDTDAQCTSVSGRKGGSEGALKLSSFHKCHTFYYIRSHFLPQTTTRFGLTTAKVKGQSNGFRYSRLSMHNASQTSKLRHKANACLYVEYKMGRVALAKDLICFGRGDDSLRQGTHECTYTHSETAAILFTWLSGRSCACIVPSCPLPQKARFLPPPHLHLLPFHSCWPQPLNTAALLGTVCT